MKDAPELTDKVLDTLATLAMINERYVNMIESDPLAFHMMAEETQFATYLRAIKPILEPFAEFYPAIKREMAAREWVYERQLSMFWSKETDDRGVHTYTGPKGEELEKSINKWELTQNIKKYKSPQTPSQT